MLKSTHRAAASHPAVSDLPPGWTEHRAPSGHLYYYNAQTKQSTYTRPAAATDSEELLIDYGASQPDQEVQASISAMQEFHKNSDPSQPQPGHFTGGRSYQDRDRFRDHSKANRQGDRPKSKTAIPDCAGWLLVKTKYGRRFVHDTDTKESFWKFPSHVMMAVIEMDRLEWEKKREAEDKKQEQREQAFTREAEQATVEAQPPLEDFDSDEYEEVEVTDDEEEDQPQDHVAKRPRIDEQNDQPDPSQPPPGPQEFNEDDIAWQLAQMEANEEDPGYDYEYDDQDLEDDEEGGMQLTKEDRDALFRTLLDQFQISPFSTFDALIETNTSTALAVISDDRWTALPNMSSRRTAFDSWSRDRVAERNAPSQPSILTNDNGTDGATFSITTKSKKTDPRISYLRFLAKEATPKLYWPEFKRKFRKAPEMTDRYFPDKDREKLYREYATKLKLSDADRKKELTALLKSVPDGEWSDKNDKVFPEKIEKDLRFYGVRDEKGRKEMVDGFVTTLKRR